MTRKLFGIHSDGNIYERKEGVRKYIVAHLLKKILSGERLCEENPLAPAQEDQKKVPKVDNTSGASSKAQPIAGFVILLLSIPLMLTYDAFDYSVTGGFLLFGLLIGIVMQRSRFCFVRAFRDPFMTGDAEATKAVVLAVIISVTGFTILKWTDLRSWDVAVQPGFWIGSLMGGIIFGIGIDRKSTR